MRCRVIKVGGSLLQYANLAARFADWSNRQEKADQTIVVVGGGRIVDEIRRFDDRFALSNVASHWLAIRAMSVTAQLFSEIVNGFEMVSTLPEPDVVGHFVLDPHEVLRQASDLPIGWHVTSDSIAWHFANRLNADELVLLKSVRREYSSLQAAAEAGYVDEYFPVVARPCPSVRIGSLLTD